MHKGMPKTAQPASKMSTDGPKWAHLGPFGGIFGHLGIPLCTYMHFYKVFVNTCAFLMNIHGKTTKTQQIAVKIMNIAQKHRKSA